jgi:predicted MPP superfamily phosphohydrolase
MQKRYPGQEGGPFHTVLKALDAIERIPPVILAIGLALTAMAATPLLLAAGIPAVTAAVCGVTLIAAMCGDLILLTVLPRAGRSFGPVKPQLVTLASLRIFVGLGLGLTLAASLQEPWSWLLLALSQLTGTLLAVRGMWVEPQSLSLTRHSLASPKWSANARPLRLLHLADIHMERITERDRQVVRLAQTLQPDTILFSGDFLNPSHIRDPIAWAELRSMLGELRAPLGVYSVSGTPAVDAPEIVPQLLDGLNVRWLRDERVTLAHAGQLVDVVGLSCTHIPDQDAQRLDALVNGHVDGRLTILLYHSPDLAPEASRLGFDLQLSGHTHGGQVRLPLFGALYANSIYGKRFEMGLRRVGDMKLYVSRGIGLEGNGAPRVRFLCPPEITLFEISASEVK